MIFFSILLHGAISPTDDQLCDTIQLLTNEALNMM